MICFCNAELVCYVGYIMYGKSRKSNIETPNSVAPDQIYFLPILSAFRCQAYQPKLIQYLSRLPFFNISVLAISYCWKVATEKFKFSACSWGEER